MYIELYFNSFCLINVYQKSSFIHIKILDCFCLCVPGTYTYTRHLLWLIIHCLVIAFVYGLLVHIYECITPSFICIPLKLSWFILLLCFGFNPKLLEAKVDTNLEFSVTPIFAELVYFFYFYTTHLYIITGSNFTKFSLGVIWTYFLKHNFID